MDYSKYFKKKGNSLIFIGDTLEIFIPYRYENHGFLDIGNTITTLGIFDMVINGNIKAGYLLAAKMEIMPTDVETTTIKTNKFAKLILNTNDVFMVDDSIVQDAKISYVLFYEMFHSGHYPEFMNYEDVALLFDYAGKATGDGFNTDHMIIEMITSVLHRKNGDLNTLYRNTDMKEQPMTIPMRLISQVAQSTTAKILGSYMNDGLEAAIVNASDVPSDVEDLLRK